MENHLQTDEGWYGDKLAILDADDQNGVSIAKVQEGAAAAFPKREVRSRYHYLWK